jgi:hypothetical protein
VVAVGLVPIATNAPAVTAAILKTSDCTVKEVVAAAVAVVDREIPAPTGL